MPFAFLCDKIYCARPMNPLIHKLISEGYLKSDSIIDAFDKINRADFLPADLEAEAEANVPLPIGFGQTISQPLTVAFMLEKLEPLRGEKILDVGAGSGWQTALLAHIVGKKGKVCGIERIPELAEFARSNLKKYPFKNIEIVEGDGTAGLKEKSPFDKIIVAAAATEVPPALKEQLKVGGRLLIPLKDNTLRLYVKTGENKFKEEIFYSFVFVPLVGDKE